MFLVADYCGIIIRLHEEDYFNGFDYPLEGNIDIFIRELESGLKPSTKPFDTHNYNFVIKNEQKCDVKNYGDNTIKNSKLHLVNIVKSAINNFENRDAIRETWGAERQFEGLSLIHISEPTRPY